MEISRFKKSRITNYELRIIILCSFVPLWFNSFSQTEQKVSSTISNVTVFINQAQITRVAKISLQPGTNQLVFDNLSPYINLNSLQVKTEGNVNLLSVSQRNNFLKTDEKSKQEMDLEDTLNAVNQLLEINKIKKDALVIEKEVVMANKKIGGENTGVKVDDLEDAFNLVRKRIVEIGEEYLKLSNQEKKLVIIRDKLANQLEQFNAQNNLEILVTVKTLSSISNAKIELSYLVTNASWTPFYDVRVSDTKSPLQLVSKAYLTQGTGEDWKNVTIKLSTSNPNEGGTKPELQTNYLRYNVPYVNSIGTAPVSASMERKKSMAKSEEGQSSLAFSDGVATVQQTAVSIEFNVTSAYTIPSDNNPHQVDLTVNNLDAIYAYGAVPKIDKDAFVTAKVSSNDIANQISGEANIYFDGTFVGKTFINGTTNDSLLISLGRDKRIQIKREKLKDFSSKSFTGSSKKELNTFETTIRNTRKEPIIIIVEDQIPVSTDKEIEIKFLNAEDANYDENTGKLTWTIKLDAEQSRSLKFSFEVKYPKEKIISEY
jgi:uncharacterized protein (TIGR02231 family)